MESTWWDGSFHRSNQKLRVSENGKEPKTLSLFTALPNNIFGELNTLHELSSGIQRDFEELRKVVTSGL